MVFVWGSLTELKEEKGTAQRREEKGTATEGRKAEGRKEYDQYQFLWCLCGSLINILFSLEFEVKIGDVNVAKRSSSRDFYVIRKTGLEQIVSCSSVCPLGDYQISAHGLSWWLFDVLGLSVGAGFR